jgi:MFS transporter, OPA family, glycerol-3-phosphate transporter
MEYKVNETYGRLRFQVFAGIFIGYTAYYLVRKNYALAMPDIGKAFPHYSNAQLGLGLTAGSLAYGFSKFLMGSVSDRCNPRWFLPLGLALSCMVLLVMGLVKTVFASLTLIVVLTALHAWFNGMGWAPCGKTMVHWFSQRERGRIVSAWNVAHNVGGGLVAVVAAWGVAVFHDWGATFYFNAAIGLVLAVLVYFLMRDTPQSCGLPPVEVYRNDIPEGYSETHERPLSFQQIFMEHVFPNRVLWIIAMANVFIYFVRYGVVDWVPKYLAEAKGFSKSEAATAWLCYEWAAIPGTLLCGWVSDKVFRSNRAPAAILFMALTLIAVIVYALNRHGPLWIDMAALISIGFLIYGPVMLIGLQALELVPKKAAGTAAGFTGFFGYVLGTAPAGAGVGWLIDKWGWTSPLIAIGISCLLAMGCCALTLRTKSSS